METGVPTRTRFVEKITEELQTFLFLAGYLYVCFTALSYLKASILHAQHIPYAPWALPAIKALVCAKFMLLGRAFVPGGARKTLLIVPTLYRSFATLIVLIVLTAIEEVVVGWIHGRRFMDSMGEIAGGTLDEFIATCIILLMILIPLFAVRSLGDVVGHHTLFRLFFERRPGGN